MNWKNLFIFFASCITNSIFLLYPRGYFLRNILELHYHRTNTVSNGNMVIFYSQCYNYMMMVAQRLIKNGMVQLTFSEKQKTTERSFTLYTSPREGVALLKNSHEENF